MLLKKYLKKKKKKKISGIFQDIGFRRIPGKL